MASVHRYLVRLGPFFNFIILTSASFNGKKMHNSMAHLEPVAQRMYKVNKTLWERVFGRRVLSLYDVFYVYNCTVKAFLAVTLVSDQL